MINSPKVFLSFAAEDRRVAEEVKFALAGGGFEVFFDKDSLPPGGDYHARISKAIGQADVLVFLVSPESVAAGNYALTELKAARQKWPHPRERVVSVRLRGTPWENIPPYLSAITMIEPEGNVAAEVLSAVRSLKAVSGARHKLAWGFAAASVLVGSVLLAYWWTGPASSAAFERGSASVKPGSVSGPESGGLSAIGTKGADVPASPSPPLNEDCPEITYTDYSKTPAEFRKMRVCEPQ